MTGMERHQTVVVGVDRSAAGNAAVRWAAAEAARRHARLHAVHVIDPAGRHDSLLETDARLEVVSARRTVPGRVALLVEEVGVDIPVAVSVVRGAVADQLVHESRDAALLVVGDPDGPQHDALPGALAGRCLCPVATVGEAGDVRVIRASDHTLAEGAGHARA